MTTTAFTPHALRLAQTFLSQGELICFPTETVYALAADATNDEAVARIYTAKGRDTNKPLSLLVRDAEQIRELCHMPATAERLLSHFSPGPLTLILPLKTSHRLSSLINPGMATIGVRIPDHPIALAILKSMATPIIGTSVNRSGEAEALCATDAINTLGDAVSLVIDGGTSQLGIASTVIDLSGKDIRILRQGSITKEQLDSIL